MDPHDLLSCLSCFPLSNKAAARPLPALGASLPAWQLYLCPSAPAAIMQDLNDGDNLVLMHQTSRTFVWLAKVYQRVCTCCKVQREFWCDLHRCTDCEQRLIFNVSARNLALSYGKKYFCNSWIFLGSVWEYSAMRFSKLMLLYYLIYDNP